MVAPTGLRSGETGQQGWVDLEHILSGLTKTVHDIHRKKAGGMMRNSGRGGKGGDADTNDIDNHYHFLPNGASLEILRTCALCPAGVHAMNQ
ncbi:hypothetical protein [Azospirillum argentinense]